MSQTRRPAAILAADVAGYSRLMGADEEGTLERLKALRRELLDPKIAEHREGHRRRHIQRDGLLLGGGLEYDRNARSNRSLKRGDNRNSGCSFGVTAPQQDIAVGHRRLR
jgi:class 3 adenylate cyclase